MGRKNLIKINFPDYNKLTTVGECIISLLFPFLWPHVYAPILPASLHHFLDAPVPFVMGLHADSESSLKIGSESTLCYVDLDKKSIQLPEELPIFPHKMDFISEITAVLDKFQIPRDRSLDPAPLITNLKNQNHDIMTSSCTLPSGAHIRRKHSLHDVLDWDRPNSPDIQNLPQRSEAYQKIVNIVRRTGVKIDDVDSDCMPNTRKGPLTPHEQYCEDLRFNNSIREIFLNRFVQIFAAYEHFVVLPNQEKDEWLTNRESLQNFDKASFLSDQPQHHRPFLSQFLESQMFATLIDNKIMSAWSDTTETDYNLKLFDTRIKILR